MTLLWYFFAGFFAWNSLPHLFKGITGQTHMTPFKRVSSPVLNIIWSFVNILIASYLLGIASGNGGFTLPWNANLVDINFWVFLVGGFVTAVWLASFFGNPNNKLPWQ